MSPSHSIILSSAPIRGATPDLFQILEELFSVEFSVDASQAIKPIGKILSAGERSVTAENISTFECAAPGGIKSESPLAEVKIVFADDVDVPFPFRGRTLASKVAPGFSGLKLAAGEKALADIDGQIVWAFRKGEGTRHYRSSLQLPIISAGGNLQSVLNGERFLEVFPLVHWLRELCGENENQGLPLRAQFMFDDPNLHWPSYGHVDYREIAARAAKSNYHVSFATVPLDNWFTHQPTATIFRENSRRLSLLVHGNNHVHQELLRNYTVAERVFLLRQSLHRIASLETAARVEVSRVMAAPHGACSEEMLAELPKCGFDGATISHGSLRTHNRSCSWVKSLGYRPAEIIQGCAVMPRWRLASSARNTILLATYLQQPIILVGHHGDLKDGLELLDELAGFINSLGTVAWLDTAGLAQINYRWWMQNGLLKVQPLGSRVRVRIPSGTKSVVVDSGGQAGWEKWQVTSAGAPPRFMEAGAPVNLSGEVQEELMLEVPTQPSVQLDEISNRREFRPFVRRLATEARDRLVSLVR